MTFYYSISNPFPQLLNLRGTGLNNGFVYLGVAGQYAPDHPIDVFWDAAGSDQASQPLQVSGGFIVNDGVPAIAYVASEYSIVAFQGGEELYYLPRIQDPVFELAAIVDGFSLPTGAASVGWIQDGTGAEAWNVLAKLRQVEVSVFDYLTTAERAIVSAYSFAADVTSAVNDAVDYAYRNSLRLKFPPGGYLVTQIVLPDNPAVDPRAYGFEMVGAGRGEAFVYVNPRGTVIRGSSATLSTLKFQQTAPNQGSGVLLIHDIRFEGTQNAGVPVVDLEALYGASRYYNVDHYQFGAGDGFSCGFMATGTVDHCYSLCGNLIGGQPAWNVSGAAARTGTGFILRADINCGLATFEKCTSRGWDQAYDIGNTSGVVTIFSAALNACECSVVTNGMRIRARAWKGTINNGYYEGVTGKCILNEGDFTTISNGSFGTGFAVGIDDSSTTNTGTLILGNELQVATVTPCTLVDVGSSGSFGGPQKVVKGNTFTWSASGGSIANIIGLKISGLNPRVEHSGNSFTPSGPWVGGAGTIAISDTSTTGLGGTGQRGMGGLGLVPNGNQQFTKLSQGAIGFGIPEDPLDGDAITAGVLTLGQGSYFQLDIVGTAPTNITSICTSGGKTNQGDFIIIECLDDNPTFIDGANLKLDGGTDYTPPAGGAILQFVSRYSNAALPVFVQVAPAVEF